MTLPERPVRSDGSTPRLSDRMEEVLRHGVDGEAREAFMSVVVSMVQHSWSEREALSTLMNTRNRAGWWLRQHARDHGKASARRELRASIDKARQWVTDHPPIGDRCDALDAISGVLDAANAEPWRGRSGTTDRIVFEALVRMAQRAGGVHFRASYRQIAEAANISLQTAYTSMGRLQSAGWVRDGHRGRGDRGSVWTLVARARTTRTVPGQGNRMTTVLLLHAGSRPDAFLDGALGGSGLRVLSAVTPEGVTVSEISDGLGLHPSTVRRRLRALADAWLVQQTDDGLWRASGVDADLDAVASLLGTAGRNNARKALHAWERQVYEDELAGIRRRARMRSVEGFREDLARPAMYEQMTKATNGGGVA